MLDSLDKKLEEFVSHLLWLLEMKTRSSAKTAITLNCRLQVCTTMFGNKNNLLTTLYIYHGLNNNGPHRILREIDVQDFGILGTGLTMTLAGGRGKFGIEKQLYSLSRV